MTPHEAGTVLLVFVAVVLYLVGVYWYALKKDNFWYVVAGVLVPMFLTGLHLYFS